MNFVGQTRSYTVIRCGAKVTLKFLLVDHPRGVLIEDDPTCIINTIRDGSPDRSKRALKKRSILAEFDRALKCKYFVVISPRSPTKDISDTIIDCIPEKYMN